MAQLITANPNGDTPKTVEDKTRALPANQGLNEYDMWQKIDAEVAAARSNSTLKENVLYPAASTGNKHGNK